MIVFCSFSNIKKKITIEAKLTQGHVSGDMTHTVPK